MEHFVIKFLPCAFTPTFERERERERERQSQRQSQGQRERGRERQRERGRERERETDRETEKQRERERDNGASWRGWRPPLICRKKKNRERQKGRISNKRPLKADIKFENFLI